MIERSNSCSIPILLILLIFIALCVPLWILPASPPPPPPPLNLPYPSCRDDDQGYTLEDRGICTHTCGTLCFPRVHGICFSHDKVTLCNGHLPIPQHIVEAWGSPPSEMRFYMDKKPRHKVPVVTSHGLCPGWNSSLNLLQDNDDDGDNPTWIRGLQMVADLTLMPTGRVGPNPHHEAEKVVPAILFSQLHQFKNSSLYWFADPDDPLMISKWSLGLLDVFSDHLRVMYMSPVDKDKPPLCFEDAILFTGVTNAGYMPNAVTHDWFRNRVLEHCHIPAVSAHKPVQDAVIVHRPNSSRNIWNYEVVKSMMEEKLHVRVKMAVPGPWAFCDQVKLVAEADVVMTPHGSQNANLLVVRPGAIVIEVFPLLYYIDWYGHYLHAGRVSHYELFGTWLSSGKGARMPLLMRVYAYLYGWQRCFFVRRCMNYGKRQQIYVDVDQLDRLFQTLSNNSTM